MAQTVIRGTQILNSTVQRQDLDTGTVGQAVVTKIVQGTNVSLSSTGADSGTGDVTINVPSTPIADSTQNGLLRQVSGNTTDFIDGTNNSQPLQPVIWSVRLRSFNAIGNPTFECDQRNVNTTLAYPAGASGQFQCDRWQISKNAATGTLGSGITNASTNSGTVVPGTNFLITRSSMGFSVGTAQATLAAGEYVMFVQSVEGPQLRELLGDVHSFQLLCQCSIPSFNFAISIRPNGSAYSLVLPCTTSATANAVTLITLPNLPLWTSSAPWNIAPGNLGYILVISVGVGSTFQAPSTGSWLAGNFLGYAGQPNILATANATFFLRFVQHEPGALCTTPIDYPFTQNQYDCLRYYQKSGSYLTPAKTDSPSAFHGWGYAATTTVRPNVKFVRPMAKPPTFTPWYNSVGQTIYIDGIGPVAVASNVTTETEVSVMTTSGANLTTSGVALFGWTADTGW